MNIFGSPDFVNPLMAILQRSATNLTASSTGISLSAFPCILHVQLVVTFNLSHMDLIAARTADSHAELKS